MATFKYEIYLHQKRRDDTYNIKIRVIHNQKKRYLSTPFYLCKDDITKTGKIKNQFYIDECEKEIKKYRDICSSVGFRLSSMSIDEVVALIKNYDSEKNWDLDFFEYAKRHLAEIEKRKGIEIGTYRNKKTAINILKRFLQRDTLSIFEINKAFLNNWVAHLDEQGITTGKHIYIANIQAIYNSAKKEYNEEERGFIPIPYNPFKYMTPIEDKGSRIRALSKGELKKIMDAQPKSKRGKQAKDLFLLSFGLMGMNLVDIYNTTDYKNGRISYDRTKTKARREDNAYISVKVEDCLTPLIDKYLDTTKERVFLFHKKYSKMTSFTYSLWWGMKEVSELVGIPDLVFYSARISWATIGRNDLGIDKYTIHEGLNHIDQDMKITDGYIAKSFNNNDIANKKILDYVGF